MTDWQRIGEAARDRQHAIVDHLDDVSSMNRKHQLIAESNRLTNLVRLSELAREFHL